MTRTRYFYDSSSYRLHSFIYSDIKVYNSIKHSSSNTQLLEVICSKNVSKTRDVEEDESVFVVLLKNIQF